jgi:cyclin C
MTDLPLLYPPHVIAITAILLALVLRPLGNGATAGGLIQAGNVATAAQSALTGGVKGTNTVDRAGGAGKSKLRIFSEWLADTEVDIEGMIDCTQELISFYEVQEQYDEKKTKEQINRYVKARGLER